MISPTTTDATQHTGRGSEPRAMIFLVFNIDRASMTKTLVTFYNTLIEQILSIQSLT